MRTKPSTLPPTRVLTSAEIGQLIRERRKELGYTQELVAAMSNCSPRLIGEIERGRATVGVQRILDLLSNLGIDITLTGRGAR